MDSLTEEENKILEEHAGCITAGGAEPIEWEEHKEETPDRVPGPELEKEPERKYVEVPSITKPVDENRVDWKEGIEIKVPSISIIVGMTESGKTHLMKKILYPHYVSGAFHETIVLCPNAYSDANINLYDFVQKKNIVTDPTTAVLENIMARQRKYKGLKTNLIIDDCTGTLAMGDKVFTKIGSYARQINLNVVIITQCLGKIPSTCKDNASQFFITKIGINDMKTVFNSVPAFPRFQLFQEYLNKHNRDYGIVRVNRRMNVKYLYCTFRCPNQNIKFRLV